MSTLPKGSILTRLQIFYEQLHMIIRQARESNQMYIRDVLRWDVKPPVGIIPIKKLQEKLLLPPELNRNEIYITQVMSGHVSNVPAILFDFQYIVVERNNTRVSPKQTLLLLDLVPQTIPHFWFSERSWADMGMIKRGWITGILSDNIVIQGPDLNAVQKIFNQKTIQYYDENPHIQLCGNGRWVLIEMKSKKKQTKRSKEQVLDFMAEGKYFLNLLSR